MTVKVKKAVAFIAGQCPVTLTEDIRLNEVAWFFPDILTCYFMLTKKDGYAENTDLLKRELEQTFLRQLNQVVILKPFYDSQIPFLALFKDRNWVTLFRIYFSQEMYTQLSE
ncbi:hypothetical protein [Niabella drilacis]|uniref:Uncharacterized protein n=1 Tax=Niabella drilacis (strain DSM 25811 / CCM 8410 / CCUG 62505 / LMG 26954 / E90) TaxID=1285928 RepID=A0A1G6JFT1_NIADE|nr:hypothetical protein [Niabella drilacis]SDC17513.1 hypothetical protein SAMN04487894_101522 [Niabella drilacis]